MPFLFKREANTNITIDGDHGSSGIAQQPNLRRVSVESHADMRRMRRSLLLRQGAPETALAHSQEPVQTLQDRRAREIRKVHSVLFIYNSTNINLLYN